MPAPTHETPAAGASDSIALPGTPLAEAVVELIRPAHTPPMFNHSIRSYLFARLLAGHLGLSAGSDYNDDLLFTACAMHDLGVAADSPHQQRFEVEGADRAAEFLTGHGVSTVEADQVWQAIALHTSTGIANRRGTLCLLVREGIALDFGGPMGNEYVEAVSEEQADAVHAVYPRLNMIGSLVDAIAAQASRSARNAPRYSIPGELLREREVYGRTRMEQSFHSSRWGN
ncbi:HD domain-containing protein [Sciscionella sediminilitoris]|uniref:HD domain-containing protein n=1 Tax=Sciscionella sediminilitoris TaxID=1445613 RepID=UPI0004DF037A|nr:HD domain-containing protein [Sciscionella sp. SE31]